jgi:hypothetical protein
MAMPALTIFLSLLGKKIAPIAAKTATAKEMTQIMAEIFSGFPLVQPVKSNPKSIIPTKVLGFILVSPLFYRLIVMFATRKA